MQGKIQLYDLDLFVFVQVPNFQKLNNHFWNYKNVKWEPKQQLEYRCVGQRVQVPDWLLDFETYGLIAGRFQSRYRLSRCVYVPNVDKWFGARSYQKMQVHVDVETNTRLYNIVKLECQLSFFSNLWWDYLFQIEHILFPFKLGIEDNHWFGQIATWNNYTVVLFHIFDVPNLIVFEHIYCRELHELVMPSYMLLKGRFGILNRIWIFLRPNQIKSNLIAICLSPLAVNAFESYIPIDFKCFVGRFESPIKHGEDRKSVV